MCVWVATISDGGKGVVSANFPINAGVAGYVVATMNEDKNLLSEVHLPEDRQLILDVLGAVRACRQPHQLCTSWTVTPTGADGYVILAYLPKPTQQLHAVEVTHDDMHLIECVNLLRVRVGVACLASQQWALKIHVTGHRAPVSLCMYDPIRVRAKRALVRDSSSLVRGGEGEAGFNGLWRSIASIVTKTEQQQQVVGVGGEAQAADKKRKMYKEICSEEKTLHRN